MQAVQPKIRKKSPAKLRGETLRTFAEVQQTGDALSSSQEIPSSSKLMEVILEKINMRKALKRVISNKGSAGVDDMNLSELPSYLVKNWIGIRDSLLAGTYIPSSVKRIEIPKADGNMRKLGIPTVIDRLIQQATQQVLSPIWEPHFSERSYGFRPKRSCIDAINKAQEEIHTGYKYVVDIDLKSFFDRVNHDRLLSKVSERVNDKRVLRLVGTYLRAGIMKDGIVSNPTEGTPQGGPLSPLLSNIVLDELDKELERRGHRFVRYADDCNIYVRTERAGERVMSGISNFIEKKLKLEVNVNKSAVGLVCERKFLGFSFTNSDLPQVRISKESLKRFKARIRTMTRRNQCNLKTQIEQISRYTRGWIGYYGRAENVQLIKSLDQWIRRRLRMLHLKRWRTPRTRYEEFRKLGMNRINCKFVSHTTKRYWYLSGSQTINFTLNLKYFRDLGLFFMMDRYEL